MKILAIIGSPHKGNTLEKTQQIEDKLRQLGDVEFEYIHLKPKFPTQKLKPLASTSVFSRI